MTLGTTKEKALSRPQLYSAGVIVAVFVAVAVSAVAAADSPTPGVEIGGDYPAFYGAGKQASDGAWDDLYDLEAQFAAQAGLHPEGDEVAIFFPYPPQVALVYQPLSSLEYHWSYLVHTIVMGLFLWLSILTARPMIPWLEGRVLQALAAALLFWPMFRAVTGGSNTALTMFLIVLMWRLVHEDRVVAAGIVLALLLYKPQFALALGGLFLLARHTRVVAGAVIGAIPFYAVGVWLQGWTWVTDWLSSLPGYADVDAEINGHSSVSFLGFLRNALGVDAPLAHTLGWALAALTTAGLAWLWWRRDAVDLSGRMAVTMPGILLLAPHTMTHDGAVALITVAILVGMIGTNRAAPWLGAIWLLGATQAFIRTLGFSPGLPMLLLILFWAVRVTGVIRASEEPNSRADGPAVETASRVAASGSDR